MKTGMKMMAMVAVAAMGFAACGGGNKPAENNDSVQTAQ
jgi:ABC-type glycerol-3-phosphate transport system substrate-binding protein